MHMRVFWLCVCVCVCEFVGGASTCVYARGFVYPSTIYTQICGMHLACMADGLPPVRKAEFEVPFVLV